MNINICGAGFSGLLLADTLTKKGYEVTVYERSKQLKAICACGIPTLRFREIARQHGLNGDDYILWKSKRLITEQQGKQRIIPMSGLCTFNKYQFMRDLNVKVQYSSVINYGVGDLVVDATGTRELLGHLPTDVVYTCYQVKAHFETLPFGDFYMRYPSNLNNTKYLWSFPLSKHEAYVGCGSLQGSEATNLVNQFLHSYNGVVLEKQAKQLRVNLPSESLPFIIDFPNNKQCVGVGTSIGAISAFGEGNEPSAVTTDLLAENINALYRYEEQVVKHLKWLKNDYAFYNSLTHGGKISLVINAMKMQHTLRKRLQTPLNPLSYR